METTAPMHLDYDTLLNMRDGLQREIRAAFANVSREGGVSWSEAFVIDDYGTMDERLAARARDHDQSWTELVDDPKWIIYDGCGGFSFLDAIGFRYYLPAAMIRSTRGVDTTLCFHLAVPRDDLRGHSLSKLSLLDTPQRRAVAGFLWFMAYPEHDLAWANHTIGLPQRRGHRSSRAPDRRAADVFAEPWLDAIASDWLSDFEEWRKGHQRWIDAEDYSRFQNRLHRPHDS